MKRMSSLLAAMTALCLLCALPGAALAQTAETPPETAETVKWPEKMTGSWVGLYENLWVQYSFYQNGKYNLTVFEDPSLDGTGTWETFGKDYSVTFGGGLMRLTVRGITSVFRRLPEPFVYVRVKTEDETVAPSVDPLLVGTWGGRIGEDYEEWTFRGDGQFARLTPYNAQKAEGRYLAGGGSLAVLVVRKMLTCAYKAGESYITVDLPEDGKVILNRKPGPLEEMSQFEDYGYLLPDYEEPVGHRVGRYFGNETEVVIPGVLGYVAVVGIGGNAFAGNKSMESITISDFIVSIGTGAFEGCEALRDVLFIGTDLSMAIPSSYNEVLGFSVIPGSCPLKTIGEGAFRGCVRLENLNLAKSARQSPLTEFYMPLGWSDVRGINLPDGVETIGANAFEGCESITSVAIPDSVTSIGKDAFKGCPNVTFIVAEGSCAYDYAKSNGIPFILRGE